MTKVQFIRQINFETQKLLTRIHKQSSHHLCMSTFSLLTPQKLRNQELKQLDSRGIIELYYLDETGWS